MRHQHPSSMKMISPVAVIFLLCLMYHTSVAFTPGSKRVLSEDIRTYIDTNGREGLIRPSTRREILFANLRAATDLVKRNLDDEEFPELRNRRCACQCRSRYHRDEWHCCTCTWTQKVCFPGHATLRRENGSLVKMVDVRRGDRVLTVDLNGKPISTTVKAFMQRNTTGFALYLSLATSTGQSLTLSHSHLVFAAKSRYTDLTPRFADNVEVGDYLLIHRMNTTERVKVSEKGHVAAEGAYTPLTDHGTLLVDDVMASCYASFDHHVAHVAMSPLRWLPSIFEPEPNAEGMRAYVRLMRTLGRWALPEGLQNEASRLWGLAMAANEQFVNKFLS